GPARSRPQAIKPFHALGTSQSSLWKRLDRLRSRAGRTWLRVKGKTWVLTEDGEAALPLAEQVVRWCAALEEGLPQALPQGLRIGCGQRAAATYVRVATRAFREAQPGVPVRVTTLRGEQRIRRVALGALDLATVTHAR